MASGNIQQDWAGVAYVTAANPAPGRETYTPYIVPSGAGYETRYVTSTDGGTGLNVYVAGGVGPSGAIPVSQTNPSQISLSGVSISGIIEVTTSAGNPLAVTGVVSVSPSPLPVTGTVGVVGTATVAVDSLPQPLQVTGAVSVDNFPSPQVVSITSSVPLDVTSSQAFPVWVTGTRVISLSSTVAQFSFPNTVLSVLPPNPNRVRFNIYNDGDQRLLIRLGPSASLSGWDTRIPSSGYYEAPFPCWCGEVTVLGQSSGTGDIYVGEQA